LLYKSVRRYDKYLLQHNVVFSMITV